MILYFNTPNKKYETIDSDKLTIQQYLTILNIIERQSDDLLELSRELCSEITNIPQEIIADLSDYTLAIIDWVHYIKDLKQLNKIQAEYLGYKLKDLNTLRFGNYIDLDYFLIQHNDNRVIDVVALMLLPNDYELGDLNTAKEVVSKMKTKDVITIFNYFTSYRANIFKQFNGLFESSDDEEYTEEQLAELEAERDAKKDEKVYSSWLETAYMLSNKDITKNDIILQKPLLEVLNYLTWLKAENEKEIRQLKK